MTRLLRSSALAAAALFLAAGAVSAQEAQEATLHVGDKAPALTPGSWLKGDPVASFEPGKVYIVEFWATWCGPCMANIPHMSKLSDEYADKGVVVIGQNVFERDREDKNIPAFLEKKGSEVSYRLTSDDKTTNEQGLMATNWMKAAGQNAIPCAFLIDKTGTVVWIGHPATIEPVLKQVVEGTYDMKKALADAAATRAKEAAEKAKAAKMQDVLKKVSPLVKKKDTAGAYAALDEGTLNQPELAPEYAKLKLKVSLLTGDMDAFYKDSDSVFDAIKDDSEALNEVAWTVATSPKVQKRDLKTAMKFASRSVELTKREDSQSLDTLARVHFDSGEVDKAIATENEAIAKSKGDKADLEKTLTKYKAAQNSGL